jgi:hypothetical protein
LFFLKNKIFSFQEIHFSKGFDMIYGEEFKVITYVTINFIYFKILIFSRNDFLEHSRYAKIAYHVATTMETVNLNEISKDQALAHLVYYLSIKIFFLITLLILVNIQ